MEMHIRTSFALAAMILMTTPPALAALPPEDAGATVPPGLGALARFLLEVPASRPLQQGAPATDATTCGSPGHCNVIACETPQCSGGQSPTYRCTATALQCHDDHDWYNPFDDDEHNVYNCEGGCTTPPPQDPDECLVYDPVSGACLIEEITCVDQLRAATTYAVSMGENGHAVPC